MNQFTFKLATYLLTFVFACQQPLFANPQGLRILDVLKREEPIIDAAPVDSKDGALARNPQTTTNFLLGNSPLRRPVPDKPPTLGALAERDGVDIAALRAYELDEHLGLSFQDSDYFDWGGWQEKWVSATNGAWYIIRPDGKVHKWNGRSDLAGSELVTELTPAYYENLSLLYKARDVRGDFLTADQKAGIEPVALQAFELDQRLDLSLKGSDYFNFGGIQEKWIFSENDGWHFLTPDGTLYKWNGSSDLTGSETVATLSPLYHTNLSLLYDASDPLAEAIENQGDVDLDESARRARELDLALNLTFEGNAFLNWGGLQEKWLLSDAGWHFILPDGTVFDWSGESDLSKSKILTKLTPNYYEDLRLLQEASDTQDVTAPTGSIVVNDNAEFTNSQQVTLSLSASDDESTVDQIEMRFAINSTNNDSYGPWEPLRPSKTLTLPSFQGTNFVNMQIRDQAGNVRFLFDSIILDSIAPVGTAVMNQDVPFTNSGFVNVSLDFQDAVSGLRRMRFSRGNSQPWTEWMDYSSEAVFDNRGADGIRFLNVEVEDWAGNVRRVFDQIVLDRVAPVGSVSINEGEAVTETREVTISLDVSDESSGVSQMRFLNFDLGDTTLWSDWEPYAPEKNHELSAGFGEKSLLVQVTDNAGNFNTFSETIEFIDPNEEVELISAPFVEEESYLLHYRSGGTIREEVLQLVLGSNEIIREGTTFVIHRVPTLKQGFRFEYDSVGNLASRTDSRGEGLTFEYDSAGRVTKIVGTDNFLVTYEYDNNGNLTQMTDQEGITLYAYDNLNQLRHVIFPDERILRYEYDLAGNLEALTYPGGMRTGYIYDANNRLTQVHEGSDITTYEYNIAGDLIKQVLPNEIQTTYDYDLGGRLKVITHEAADETLILKLEYEFDANGNQRQITETLPGSIQVTRYDYDALSRLKEVETPDGRVVTYAYDAAGNREQMLEKQNATDAGILTTYFYGLENRLESLTKTNVSSNTVISEEFFYYDPRGNLALRVTPEKSIRYTYDLRNLLTRVEEGTSVTEFRYDGLGNRIAKIIDGVRTNYLVETSGDLAQVLQEFGTTGTPVKNYTLGSSRFSVTNAVSGEKQYYLTDALNSTQALTNAQGQVTQNYSYDVFGLPTSENLSSPNPFTYTGEQFDSETNLVYLRARYYDPGLGRFLSKDPVLLSLSQTQSVNPYLYVQNNPVNRIDPTGRFVENFCARFMACQPMTEEELEIIRKLNKRAERNGQAAAAVVGGTAIGIGVASLASTIAPATAVGITLFGQLYATNSVVRNAVNSMVSSLVSDDDIADVSFNSLVSFADDTLANASGFQLAPGQPGLISTGVDFIGRAFNNSFSRNTVFGNGRSFLDDDDRLSGFNDGGNSGRGGSLLGGSLLSGPTGFGGGVFNTYSRGGVLINKSAQLIGENLNSITGATIDSETGQLVLLGTKDANVPDIKAEDLITALRSVYGSIQPPGVSIDPPPEGQGGPGSNQTVRYLGGLEHTDLGYVVFEADRVMKTLSGGKDNITGEVVTSNVPGYRNVLQIGRDLGIDMTNSRFWFVPDVMDLTRSSDGKSVVFSDVKIKLLTANQQAGQTEPSQVAIDFASHFTEHYDLFAQEFPIFERLRQVMKAVALARFIKDNQIPIDFSLIDETFLAPVNTPFTTPTLVNNIPGLGTVEGGVAIEGTNQYLVDADRGVQNLSVNVLNSREDRFTQNWQVTSGEQTLNAVALSLTPDVFTGNIQANHTDVLLPTSGEIPLGFTRFYDSFGGDKSDFGFGWKSEPVAAFFERPAYRNSVFLSGSTINGLREGEVRIRDRRTGEESRFLSSLRVIRNADGRISTPGIQSDRTTLYTPVGDSDGSRFIMNSDHTFHWTRQDGSTVHFGNDGAVLRETDRLGNYIEYVYSDGRLEKLVDSLGRELLIEYDANNRISQVTGPLQTDVTYHYDDLGRLASVRNEHTNRARTYKYDEDNRLVESVDAFGFRDFQSNLDVWGVASSETDLRGNEFRRTFNREAQRETIHNATLNRDLVREYDAEERLIREINFLGEEIFYEYQNESREPSAITDASGHRIELTYNLQRNLTKIVDPDRLNTFGATLEFQYNSAGQVVWARDAKGIVRTFEYDGQGNLEKTEETLSSSEVRTTLYKYDAVGNLTSITDANTNTFGFDYDLFGNVKQLRDGFGNSSTLTYEEDTGLLSSIEDELKRELSFDYDAQDQLREVKTVFGTVQFGYDAQGNITTTLDPLNQETRFTYDPATGDLLQVIDSAGEVVNYTYDEFGRLASVLDARSELTVFHYDALGQLVYVGADLEPFLLDQEARQESLDQVVIDLFASEPLEAVHFELRKKGDVAFQTVDLEAIDLSRFRAVLKNLESGVAYEYQVTLEDRTGNVRKTELFEFSVRPEFLPFQIETNHVSPKALSANFRIEADKTISRAVLHVVNTLDQSERVIAFEDVQSNEVRAEVGGLEASTNYTFFWEIFDGPSKRQITPVGNFETAASDSSFFIRNHIIATGSDFARLQFEYQRKPRTPPFFYYRKLGEQSWNLHIFGTSVQQGEASIRPVFSPLEPNTEYEYKLRVDIFDVIVLPGGGTTTIPTTKTSQIQRFRTDG